MKKKEEVAKKPYTPPQAKEVSLRAEEAVLSNCKMSSGAGGAGGMGNCAHPSLCVAVGS